jgi:signal transduction histidine kinase
VRATAADLAACVDALLGNVFAHTPDGSPLAVRLADRPVGGAILVVADGGEGFAAANAVDRGASRTASTGLGMDIARRAAESSGGRLSIGTSDLGGAEVTVELGPASPASAG